MRILVLISLIICFYSCSDENKKVNQPHIEQKEAEISKEESIVDSHQIQVIDSVMYNKHLLSISKQNQKLALSSDFYKVRGDIQFEDEAYFICYDDSLQGFSFPDQSIDYSFFIVGDIASDSLREIFNYDTLPYFCGKRCQGAKIVGDSIIILPKTLDMGVIPKVAFIDKKNFYYMTK